MRRFPFTLVTGYAAHSAISHWARISVRQFPGCFSGFHKRAFRSKRAYTAVCVFFKMPFRSCSSEWDRLFVRGSSRWWFFSHSIRGGLRLQTLKLQLGCRLRVLWPSLMLTLSWQKRWVGSISFTKAFTIGWLVCGVWIATCGKTLLRWRTLRGFAFSVTQSLKTASSVRLSKNLLCWESCDTHKVVTRRDVTRRAL